MLTKKSLIALFLSFGLCTACFGKKQESKETVTAPPPATSSSVPAAKPAEAPAAAPAAAAPTLATPIDAVKGFFDAVSKEQYDVAWATLTKASQDKFITMVASDEKMEPAKVRELFEQTQTSIRIGFWRSFRNSSKLDLVAPTATYKVLNEGPEQAEVEMTSGDVVLKSKAFKEGSQWKMGYVETFLP